MSIMPFLNRLLAIDWSKAIRRRCSDCSFMHLHTKHVPIHISACVVPYEKFDRIPRGVQLDSDMSQCGI